MVQKGVNVSLGTDGNNASNYSDLMRASYLAAGIFKDAREDPQMFPAEKAFEMATIDGAKTLLMDQEIGSLEIGKKADLVLHDTDRPEWRPLLNVMNQLVWSADGRGVHTVLVDGQTVVEAGRCLTVDEEKLWSDVQQMGEAITGRSACRIKRNSQRCEEQPKFSMLALAYLVIWQIGWCGKQAYRRCCPPREQPRRYKPWGPRCNANSLSSVL